MSRLRLLLLIALLPLLANGKGGHGGSHGGHGGHFGGGGHSGGGSYHGGGSSNHAYPHSGGYSGHGTGGQQSHGYPPSSGHSGNNHHSSGGVPHKTEVHHHYHPPQQIHYHGQPQPVYHGSPPVYVYTYRDSGSRYDNLLTGLALYNLGRMSGHHDGYHSSHNTYTPQTGEQCKLQIYKSNGEYEQTKIDCQLMSSFIWDAEREEREKNRVVSNTNSVTSVNVTRVEHSENNGSSVVTTTTQNSTVVNALEAKGPSIQVTKGMDCFMVRTYRESTIRKKVDCGLLQHYATSSFRNHSARDLPVFGFVILLTSVMCLV